MTIIARKPTAKTKAAAKTAKILAKTTAAKRPPLKKALAKAVATAKKASAKKVVSPKAKKVAPKKAVAAKTLAPKKAVAKKPVLPKAGKAAVPKAKKVAKVLSPTEQLLAHIKRVLDDGKAEDIVAIDMAGKSAIADYMVIATGRSQRQLAALAENLRTQLKMTGKRVPHPEGMTQGDWVLLDAGDVIVHLFRPEVRGVYNLEKMWSQPFADSPNGMEGLIKERQERQQREDRAERAPHGSKPDFRKRNKRRH